MLELLEGHIEGVRKLSCDIKAAKNEIAGHCMKMPSNKRPGAERANIQPDPIADGIFEAYNDGFERASNYNNYLRGLYRDNQEGIEKQMRSTVEISETPSPGAGQ